MPPNTLGFAMRSRGSGCRPMCSGRLFLVDDVVGSGISLEG